MISIASAWDPWLRYVALGTSPPEYPTRVEITPGRFRIRSCIPQKHPPARIAVSVESVMSPPCRSLPSRYSPWCTGSLGVTYGADGRHAPQHHAGQGPARPPPAGDPAEPCRGGG